MTVTLPNEDKPSNSIRWSSLGFHSIFHESRVLWFVLDHTRSEVLTFLLRCTTQGPVVSLMSSYLPQSTTLQILGYSFSNQSIFQSSSVFARRFLQKICSPKLQSYHQHIGVFWFRHYRFLCLQYVRLSRSSVMWLPSNGFVKSFFGWGAMSIDILPSSPFFSFLYLLLLQHVK